MTQKRGKSIFVLLPLSFVIIYFGAISYFIDIRAIPYTSLVLESFHTLLILEPYYTLLLWGAD